MEPFVAELGYMDCIRLNVLRHLIAQVIVCHTIYVWNKSRVSNKFKHNTQHTHTHTTHTHTNIGIVECDETIERFACPVCYKTCCMKCKVHPYHIGMSCEKYKERHCFFVDYNERNDAILASNLINEGAVSCPQCHEIIIKIGGC